MITEVYLSIMQWPFVTTLGKWFLINSFPGREHYSGCELFLAVSRINPNPISDVIFHQATHFLRCAYRISSSVPGKRRGKQQNSNILIRPYCPLNRGEALTNYSSNSSQRPCSSTPSIQYSVRRLMNRCYTR